MTVDSREIHWVSMKVEQTDILMVEMKAVAKESLKAE